MNAPVHSRDYQGLSSAEAAARLRQIGLMGIGQRNAEFVLAYNQRKFYPRVDDKLITKKMAIKDLLGFAEKVHNRW